MYRQIRDRLKEVMEAGEAQAIAFLLLEKVCGLSRTDILMADSLSARFPTDEAACHAKRIEQAVQRLLAGEPVQYVLGEADFCGNTFHVAPGVLIPRPETEELVEWTTETIREKYTSPVPPTGEVRRGLSILDIGTGSGCIAISLALRFPDAYVEAWDISSEALAIAEDNARRLGTDVHFAQVDILRPETFPADSANRFDIIVSNPPYIPQSQAADMEAHVLGHEPHTALFVPDDDPLLFYRAILGAAGCLSRPDHTVMLEASHTYAAEVARLSHRNETPIPPERDACPAEVRCLSHSGDTTVQLRHDQFGQPRMIKIDNKTKQYA